MNTLDKMIGAKGCLLIVGSMATEMPDGYTAYAAMIRIDDTEFTSIDEISGGQTVTGVNDLTWMGNALSRGDYIPFEYPVTSIKLTNTADSILAYLQ